MTNGLRALAQLFLNQNQFGFHEMFLLVEAEQFDSTHDFLGQKLAKLENCIFRSARDRFPKRLLFSNRYNKSIFCPISKRISLFGSSFFLSRQLNIEIYKFRKFIADSCRLLVFDRCTAKISPIRPKNQNLIFLSSQIFVTDQTCEYDVILTIFVFFWVVVDFWEILVFLGGVFKIDELDGQIFHMVDSKLYSAQVLVSKLSTYTRPTFDA